MKLPDLTAVSDAGIHDWSGPPEAAKAAAAAAKLKFCLVDLHGVGGKTELMSALQTGLKLPSHFGNNWDALADSVEDSAWLGNHGVTILLRHAAAYRKSYPADYEMLSDILGEAAEYWQERHKPFWVLVG